MADIPPPPIDHRSLEHHYTKDVSHIEECTYNTTRPNKFHIYKNAHMAMADIPPAPIDHGSLEHHCTEDVSHIEECIYNTTTPNKFHI